MHSTLRLYSKKNMVYMGPYAGDDFNSPYLIVNSVVRYPPHYKMGWSREDLSLSFRFSALVQYLSANFQNQFFYVNTSTEKWEEGVRADLMSLNRNFMEHGQPHA